MSDMSDHRRDDLKYGGSIAATLTRSMPETDPGMAPAKHRCGCSEYLCEICNPRRSIIRVIRDVSVYRDLPMSYYELIRPRPSNVVSLSERRRA
jgi:hypothetical protein